MKNFKSLFIIAITLLATLGLQAQRQGGANLDPNVKGMNVGKAIEIYRTTVKHVWTQIGDKTWTRTQENNAKVATFTETHRDEWSVYLIGTDDVKMQIDLWQKRVYDRTNGTDGNIIEVALRPQNDVATNVVSIENRWKPGQFISLNNAKMYATQPTTFKIEQVDGPWFRLLDTKSGNYLNFEKEQLNSGNIQPGWWSAQFRKVPTEEGYFRLQCRMKGGIYYLHIEHGKLECSRLGDMGWWSAQWKLKETTLPANPSNPDADNPELKQNIPDIATMAVAIVYPRNAADNTDLCGTDGENSIFIIDGSFDINGVPGELIKGQYKNNFDSGFCECFNEPSDKFLACIIKHKEN